MGNAARIVSSTPLVYADGADRALDRPPHVRAGSGAAFVVTPNGARLAVCQDDAAFLALVDVATGRVESLTLPAGPGGARQFEKARGNKMDKLDLESAVLLPTHAGARLHLFGSGSAPVREVVVTVDLAAPASSAIELHDMRALFTALRDGVQGIVRAAELNIEGVCLRGTDELVLLQRGNGDGHVNAVAQLPWPADLSELDPGALRMRAIDIGDVDGVPLTFTDACARGDRVWFLAAAEASPNAIDDGEVVGCALGVLDESLRRVEMLAPLLDATGAPYRGKPEGLAFDDTGTAWLVTDMDDPVRPSDLLRVHLE